MRDPRGADTSGEAVRVDVRELRPLSQVQQQVGVLGAGDRVVDVVDMELTRDAVEYRGIPAEEVTR